MRTYLLGGLLLLPLSALAQETCPPQRDATNPCIQATLAGCDVTCDNSGITTTVTACLAAEFDGSDANCIDGACSTAVFRAGTTVTCDANSCQDSTFADATATCIDTNACDNS